MATKDKIVEKADFIQHHLPGLEDGNYLLTVQNQLKDPNNLTIITEEEGKTTPVSYKFAVKGPRYSINPGGIHAIFPPADSVGVYETVIPHIVLTRKSFPWQRSPYVTSQEKGTFSYKEATTTYTYDQNVPSWLAVLLLNEDDFGFSPAKLVFHKTLRTGTVADLLPSQGDTFVSTLSLQGVKSDGSGLEIGENLTDLCTYVQIPTEVFEFIAPSVEDLKMMAHVRQVDVSNKPTDTMTKVKIEQIHAAGAVVDTNDMGIYSIVLGNRLPASGKQHLAVLVSLEGLEDYLPMDGGVKPSKPFPAGATSIRLPALKAWHFNSQKEKYNFDTILKNLNGGNQVNKTLNQPQLQFYPSDSTNLPIPTQNAFKMGYIPINHRTTARASKGQSVNIQTVSWYRGPLTPVAVPAGVVNPTQEGMLLIYHPDSLRRINPNTGLYDVSYAAAWQLGQLLALQDKSFSTLLYHWKQETLLTLVQQIDQYLMYQNTDSAADLKTGAETDKLNADFYEGIINLLSKVSNPR